MECVKQRQERFGGGLGFSHAMSFRIRKPRCWRAKPTEKMLWWVPVTQSVPFGFWTRRQPHSQARLNLWSAWKPPDLSQLPLSTEMRRPPWQVEPPLGRKYGGSNPDPKTTLTMGSIRGRWVVETEALIIFVSPVLEVFLEGTCWLRCCSWKDRGWQAPSPTVCS